MDTTNVRQIAGGTVIKQADRSSTMSFILQDAIGREVDLDGQTAQVALYTLKGKYWETSTQVKGAMVSFSLPGNLSEDDYILDISVAGYVFPSDRDFIIRVVKGYADLMDKETAESARDTLASIRKKVEEESEKRLTGQLAKIDEKSESTIQAIESDGQEYIKLIGTNKSSAVAEIEAKKKEVLNTIEQKRQEFKGDPGKDGKEFGWNLLKKGDTEFLGSTYYCINKYDLVEQIEEGAEVSFVIKAKGKRTVNRIFVYNSGGTYYAIKQIEHLNDKSDESYNIYVLKGNWNVGKASNNQLYLYWGDMNSKPYEPVDIQWVKLVYGLNPSLDFTPAQSEIHGADGKDGQDGTVNIAEMTESQLLDVKKQLDIPVADDFVDKTSYDSDKANLDTKIKGLEDDKVSKEAGKVLSDNNFTNSEKKKVNQLDDFFNSSLNRARRLTDVYGQETLPDILETYHKLKPGYYFVSPDSIENQPTSYGFLTVLKFTTEFSLIWQTQSQGFIYRKSGNANTMYDWEKLKVDVSEQLKEYATKDDVEKNSSELQSTFYTSIAAINTEVEKKAYKEHTHAIADISNLQTTLDDKAPRTHTHSQYITTTNADTKYLKKGDPIELTTQQKAELKGEPGKDGVDGKPGDPGKGIVDSRSGREIKVWIGDKSDYDSIGTKDGDTLYLIWE